MRTSATAIIALTLLSTSAAYAQQSASQEKAAPDPNEKICEDVIQTGSRLASKRICATRSQWEDKKRQDREAVEKAQLSPCVLQTTSASGKPSC